MRGLLFPPDGGGSWLRRWSGSEGDGAGPSDLIGAGCHPGTVFLQLFTLITLNILPSLQAVVFFTILLLVWSGQDHCPGVWGLKKKKERKTQGSVTYQCDV